jgi:acyl-CoA synthetase (AMP-forming)/AMP-acid ligase II
LPAAAPPHDPAPARAAERLLEAKGWPRPRWRDKWRALFLGAGRFELGTLPDQLAALYGERPAFFCDPAPDARLAPGGCVTHEGLARGVDGLARGLARIGVRPGERVGLLTRNRVELVFAEFAAARLGAVLVPFNAMLRVDELRELAGDCALRTLVVDREIFAGTFAGRAALPGVERWVLVGSDDPPPGTHALFDLVDDTGGPGEIVRRPPHALAAIFYTAGTTGRPKGAMLSEGALLWAVRQQARLAAWLPTPRHDLALLVMPLAHTSGHQALLLQLVMGTPMLLHGRFAARDVLAAIERYRVTQLSGVPTFYRMLLDAGAEEFDLGSIELCGWGGDAMPEEIRRRFDELVRRRGKRPRWVTGYGLAETAGQLTRALRGPWSAGSAGRPLPGVRARILDETGRPVRRGEIGELWVHSPGVMQGYLGDLQATLEVLRDGWLRTGDLARRGPRGRLLLAARVKEMIKVGGYSVFPAEVERALEDHPGVAQAAVVGIPDPVRGMVPAAAVVRRAGSPLDEAELVAWARERVAPYKAPRHVVFVDALPLSSALKMRRVELAVRVRAALAAREPSARAS